MVGRALSLLLTWAEGRAVSGGWPREATLVFCPALGGVCARGHAQYSAFALQKWHLGLFGLFVSSVQNLSQLGMRAVILSPV